MSNNTDLAKYLLQFEELQAKVSQAQQRLQKILPDKAKQKDEEENHGSGSSVSIYVEKTVTGKSSSTGSFEMSPAHKKQRLTDPAFNNKWHKNISSLMQMEKWNYLDNRILDEMKTWSQDNIIQFFKKSFKNEEKFAAQPIDEQLKHVRKFCEENSIPLISEESNEEEEEEEEEEFDEKLNKEVETENDEEVETENDEEVETETDGVSDEY